MNQWQTIETAPKDGTVVLVCVVIDGIVMARTAKWVSKQIGNYNPDGGFWVCPNRRAAVGDFTHWKPLEAPTND